MCRHILEKPFELKIRKYLESRGHWVVKYFAYGYAKSGIPELLACVNGRFVAIEVKGDGDYISPVEEFTLCRIINSGGVSMVVRSQDFETFCRCIEEIEQKGVNR